MSNIIKNMFTRFNNSLTRLMHTLATDEQSSRFINKYKAINALKQNIKTKTTIHPITLHRFTQERLPYVAKIKGSTKTHI